MSLNVIKYVVSTHAPAGTAVGVFIFKYIKGEMYMTTIAIFETIAFTFVRAINKLRLRNFAF